MAEPSTATNEAVLITEPPPASQQMGDPVLAAQEHAAQVDRLHPLPGLSEVSSTEASSVGEMPALLNSTSIRPSSARARA